ncbi:MAG TPA: protein-L-isoaspartate(D-aspartate) O-methyltransferase [Candidatus Limnocylindrales bacterium]|nr:protein-L-isoaspartate(D-aspartate) O-methyltransferase [Candidatus Limnocylindrales bacterium]
MIGLSIVDFEKARKRMVEEQLIQRGIQDARVLAAMTKVPRHLFVEEALQDRAYDDYPLPIGENQTISQPYMVGVMTQALKIDPEDRILEIGTGSAYQTAVLAELAYQVFSIERLPSLATKAWKILDYLRYYNVLIKVGDGTLGWKEHAPYNGIIVTASAPNLPKPLLEQLVDGGRLVIPIGNKLLQHLKVFTKKGDTFEVQKICQCTFVKLLGKYGWET